MRRYGLLLMVLVLASASLLAAAAYNTATVANAGTLTINNTNQALLALVPHGGSTVGAKDATARVENGVMVFDFGRGINPHFDPNSPPTPPGANPFNYGLQKNSTYIWGTGASNQGLFAIQNRSAETIDIYMTLGGIPAGVDVYVDCTAGHTLSWTQLVSGTESGVLFTLGSGCSCDVNFKIVVGNSAALGTVSMNLDVKATAK